MDSQLKTGFIEVAILSILQKHDSYGFSIIQELSDKVTVAESTLFSVLKHLELQGFIKIYSVEFNGRLRTYYQITPDGRALLNNYSEEWHDIEKLNAFISREQLHDS